ncbi:MAG: methionine adenosyltransferase domain-containing protein, partial [Muribaculaceae bacterium]|nr:methionine adenosyltransferase domain-containing protein [Muribaculaceae bacterium]
VAYALGVAQPVSLYVHPNGTAKGDLTDAQISERIAQIVDMRPAAIEKRLKLRAPIYQETATYGHVGRTPRTVTKHFESRYEGVRDVTVELFTWEKLDLVDSIRQAFGLS